MRKVIFDLLRNATGMVLYPDNIAYFSNTTLDMENHKIIADYSGAQELTGYAPVKNYGRIISVEAHLNHFTLDEKATIDLLSIDTPEATAEVRLSQAKIRQVLKQLDRSTEINLDDEKFQEATMATCELLVTAGFITDAHARFDLLVHTPLTFSDLPERLKLIYPKS